VTKGLTDLLKSVARAAGAGIRKVDEVFFLFPRSEAASVHRWLDQEMPKVTRSLFQPSLPLHIGCPCPECANRHPSWEPFQPEDFIAARTARWEELTPEQQEFVLERMPSDVTEKDLPQARLQFLPSVILLFVMVVPGEDGKLFESPTYVPFY